MIDLSLMHQLAPNVFVFKKWNWDYLEAEAFQLDCVEFVRKNPHLIIFIICSHPHCFTLGRGLQKVKDDSNIILVDFQENAVTPFPLHLIKRGGGLTFHYPGQMVFYPILNLTTHKKAVFDLMLSILEITKNVLEIQLSFSGLSVKRDLLGLWFENEFSKAKIASIGLAASRFNTYHGLALNFFHDEEMFQALRSLHPCGLPGDLYRDVELLSLRKFSFEDREKYVDEFLEKMRLYLFNEKAN
jgi:lipoyl(octanoyl) transferase